MIPTERRAAVEFRRDGRRLVGYAAVFDALAKVADFTEKVAPGAFRATLESGADVVALVDHDIGKLLARTKSGTLRLAEDARGLAFDLDLPDTQLGRDTLALAERGDLGGASFGFIVEPGGDTWQGRERTLRRVKLVDVSIVQSFAAYPQTSVSWRTLGNRSLAISLARRYLET
jgi:HK97 family phage prohead protease